MEGEIWIEPLELLRELYERDVPYLLVGRQALVLLGAPLMTADYDFFLSPEREHLERLLELAGERKLECSARDPADRPLFALQSDTQRFDFFRARTYTTKLGEELSFDELWSGRQALAVRDFAIYLPSIPDLIRTKQIRNSPHDREDIKYLQVLLERG